jgi:Zn-dependent protease
MDNEVISFTKNEDDNNNSDTTQKHIQDIIDALMKLENSKKSVWKSLIYFLISVAVFASLGLFYNPIIDLTILVGVILFHEFGHYLAMNLFGYKDVKVFFIPFFGAAISGKSDNISGVKKAIVSLAGPVPGIILGILTSILTGLTENYVLNQLSIMLLFINGFNLLPIYPLDGGRFLFDVILSRQKYVEAIFKILTIIILAGIAIYFEDWIFGFIAAIVIGTVKQGYLISSLAEKLSEEKELIAYNQLLDLPRNYLEMLVNKVLMTFPNLVGVKVYAKTTIQLWEKLKNIPPSLAQSIGLLVVYFIALFIIIWPLIG